MIPISFINLPPSPPPLTPPHLFRVLDFLDSLFLFLLFVSDWLVFLSDRPQVTLCNLPRVLHVLEIITSILILLEEEKVIPINAHQQLYIKYQLTTQHFFFLR